MRSPGAILKATEAAKNAAYTHFTWSEFLHFIAKFDSRGISSLWSWANLSQI